MYDAFIECLINFVDGEIINVKRMAYNAILFTLSRLVFIYPILILQILQHCQARL